MSDLLLACDFTLLLSFQILLSLALDELTLKHLFLELLDIAQLEVFELLADIFCVCLLKLVLLLELSAHLFIVLGHFLALHLDKVLFNVSLHIIFALSRGLLGFLLISNIAHKHLAFKSLDHILLIVHRFSSFIDLLYA